MVSVLLLASLAAARAAPADIPSNLTYHIPDQHNYKFQTFTINAFNNYLTLNDLALTFPASGQAEAAFSSVELNIGHYTLDGEEMKLHIVGDGTISLVLYGTMVVDYTAKSGGNCATAGSTKFTVNLTKVDAHITGVKAGIIPADKIVDEFLDKSTGKVGNFITAAINGKYHDVVDGVAVALINGQCSGSVNTAVEAAVEALLYSLAH